MICWLDRGRGISCSKILIRNRKRPRAPMQNTKMRELITKLVLKRCGTTTKTCVTYGNLHLAYEYRGCTSGLVYVPCIYLHAR